MGFDNECVLNIQSLPGEYFCPVCRTLIYPNEALQSQCTHLYCKPCLAYIVATTHACPYDGYLVTEADSKPLMESNKSLAETIGKVAVHCLYHRSGCQWQGGLSDCITHCAECTFGNSAVICNRCGTQIMHRQVQEHGQTCAGVSQTPQVEGQAPDPKAQAAAQDQPSTTTSAPVPVTSTAPATTAAPTASASVITSIPTPAAATATTGQVLPQGNNAAYAQTAAQAPTPEQWYQQQQQLQYQQYYQYHGYDPYQQQYQQYAQYQQQAYAQYGQPQVQVAPQQAIQGGQQPQQYMVVQPYPQHQPQPQPQLQPQSQPQAQPVPQQQPQAHPVPQQQTQAQPAPQALVQAQPVPPSQPPAQVLQQPSQQHQAPHSQQQLPLQPQPQAHAQHPLQAHQFHAPVQQPHQQAPPQTHPPPHSQLPGQQLLQPQPHHPQPQTHHQVQQQQLQAPPLQPQPVPQQQPPHSQMQHMQPQLQQQSYPQHQSQPRPQLHPQSQLQQPPNQLQPHPTSQPQSFPQPQAQHPSAHAVTGHQSFPQPQPQQQIPPGPPQHRPMQVPPQQHQTQHPHQSHNQFPPQQPPPMRPSHAQLPMQVQQQHTMMPPQVPHANLLLAQQQGQRPVQQQGQQIHQHHAVQPHGQQQGLPQQQAHAPLHPGHPHSQGTFPPQQVPHPQQALRTHGQTYMQQQIPMQPHLQQNSMPAISGSQAQPGLGRPMMPPQQPLHQSPATNATVVQAGMNQQSPQPRAAARLASIEVQPGSMMQNQVAQPSSHDGLLSASPASRPGVESKTLKSENDLKSASNEGAVTADAKEKDIQPINDGKAATDSATTRDGSDIIESHKKDENMEETAAKKGEASESVIVKIEKSEVSKGSQGKVELSAGETIENVGQKVSLQLPDGTGTVKSQIDSMKVAEHESLNSIPQKASQHFAASQGQTSGSNVNTIQPQHLPHQKNQLHELPAHGASFSQTTGRSDAPQGVPHMDQITGQERHPIHQNLHAHPHRTSDPTMLIQRPPAPGRMFPEHMHHSGSTVGRSFPDHPHEMALHGQPPVPIPTVQNFPEMLPPQGHPLSVAPEPFQIPAGKQSHGPWRPEVPHSRLTGSDPPASFPRVPPQFGHPQKSFEEQAMAPHGQNLNHIPPSHDSGPRNFPGENYGQPFMSGPLPGLRGPQFGHEGQMGMVPPNSEQEAYATKRQPEIIHPLPSEHPQFGPPPHGRSNAMIMNNGVHDSGFTHGLPNERLERFKSFHEDGFNVPPDERFRNSGMDIGARAVSRRDFEEDLKQFPRPSHLDDGYNTSSRPSFGSSRPLDKVPYASDGGPNALTSRPLPPHQASGSFPIISGAPQLRPMDIGGRPVLPAPHEDIGRRNDSTAHIGSRMDSLPPFRSPGREYTDLLSNRYGSGTRSHMDDFNGTEPRGFGDHSKTFNFPPDPARSALQESKIPGLPSSSLPGYFRRGDHDGPGNMQMAGHKGSGNLIDPTRKDMDGPETFPNRFGPSEPRSISTGEFSPHNLPGHLRGGESLGQGQMRMNESIGFGGIPRHLRMEDPIGSIQLPSHLRAGERIGGNFGGHVNTSEPGFGSSFLKHNFPSEAKNSSPGLLHGDLDSFERSRGRKPGSMGWCRICKIDCVSVEGLDLHSQSREHQTMTMDLVLSIKQENTKRQKLSGGNMPHDDTNKMRQATFENRMK